MGEGGSGDDEAMQEFGHRLRAIRKAAGLSQEQLGHLVGVHRTHIGHLEQGKTNPKMLTILQVARGLGIQPGVLLDDL